MEQLVDQQLQLQEQEQEQEDNVLSQEERSMTPRGLNDKMWFTKFRSGFALFWSSFLFFFKMKLWKTVKCELISVCLFHVAYLVVFVVIIVIEYFTISALMTAYTEASMIMVWVLLLILLALFVGLLGVLMTVLDSCRKLSVFTENIMFDRAFTIPKGCKPYIPTPKCATFTIAFSVIWFIDILINGLLCFFLLLIVWVPCLGVVVFVLVEGLVQVKFGITVIFLRKGKLCSILKYMKENFPVLLGVGTGLGIISLIPFFGSIFLFFFAPVVCTKVYFHIEHAKDNVLRDEDEDENPDFADITNDEL